MSENIAAQGCTSVRLAYVKPEITSMDAAVDIVQAATGGGAGDSGVPPAAYS